MLGYLGEKIADPNAALTMLPKTPRRGEQVPRRGKLNTRLGKRKRFTIVAREQRFWIERVDVRWPPFHKHENDPLGPRSEMRRLRCKRIRGRFRPRFVGQQAGKCKRAEPHRRVPQETPTRNRKRHIRTIKHHWTYTNS